jgi:hypothetical protein
MGSSAFCIVAYATKHYTNQLLAVIVYHQPLVIAHIELIILSNTLLVRENVEVLG